MIRVALIAVLVAAAGAGGYFALAAGGDAPPEYKLVLDNSFGLTLDADVKAAGVRVGKVADLDVQRGTNRALVTAQIDKPDFGDFRADVFCSVEPQSLIGEYFLNCDPGTSSRRLPEGATIPVEQTATTVPPDLVNNIMRQPFRERFRILFSEFGAAFATRGPELQATIKRAIPALRETDRVLRVLSEKRRTIEDLTREGDQVMARLAANRDDVARFVSEARDTAAVSADRRVDLAENIRLLPPFLRRLRPVLRDLGTAADRQTPALRDLRRSAGDLELLLERLGPFSNASVPAVRSLGEASRTGRVAMRAARPTIAEARELGELARDPVRNLRFVLEHLDDRKFAVEPNPLSPGGKGFTGLEAILQYPFVQSQAINIFDNRGYILKLNALPSPCSAYQDGEDLDPEVERQCSAALGPEESSPGEESGQSASTPTGGSGQGSARSRGDDGGQSTTRGGDRSATGERGGGGRRGDRSSGGLTGALDDLVKKLPATPSAPQVPDARGGVVTKEQQGMLDFLLAP